MGGLCFKPSKEDLDNSFNTYNDSDEEIPALTEAEKMKQPRKGASQRKKRRLLLNQNSSKTRTKKRHRVHPVKNDTPDMKKSMEIMDSLKTKTLEIFASISSHKTDSEAPLEELKEVNDTWEDDNAIIKSASNEEIAQMKTNSYDSHTPSHLHAPRHNQKMHQSKPQTKYIKKLIAPPADFITLLDSEISIEVLNSLKLIQDLSPICGFIQKHIQAIARNIFIGSAIPEIYQQNRREHHRRAVRINVNRICLRRKRHRFRTLRTTSGFEKRLR